MYFKIIIVVLQTALCSMYCSHVLCIISNSLHLLYGTSIQDDCMREIVIIVIFHAHKKEHQIKKTITSLRTTKKKKKKKKKNQDQNLYFLSIPFLLPSV